MRAVINSIFIKSLKSKILFVIFHFAILISTCSLGQSNEKPLLIVHDRAIPKDEFLYYFQKSNQEINEQNIAGYLEPFINFQLKLADAREERVQQNIAFINELTEYRLQLAAPYLTDKEKEKELALEAYERLKFEVKASYILIKLNPDARPEDTLKAYAKAVQIRNRILGGEAFDQTDITESDNYQIIRSSGKFDYFTAFQSEYPFETAVYKMKPGEISMLVRSGEGYYIIQMNDKRKAGGELKTAHIDKLSGRRDLPSFEEMEPEIINLIKEAKDERNQIIEDSFVEKLKKSWRFQENPDALEKICNFADERVYTGNWIAPANQSFNESLFFIDGKGISQTDFIEFMQNFKALNKNLSVRDYIFSLYKHFVSKRLILYENYKLNEKYPEFRFQYGEYRDAMLLDQITKKRVWFKADSDRKGLEDFFAENRENYKLKESLSAIIVTSPYKKEAKHISKRFSKSLNRGEGDIHKILNQLDNESGSHQLTLEEGIFAKGDNPLIDQIKWEAGVSKIQTSGNKYYFVIVENIVEPKYQKLEEVSDKVQNDYQNYLMENWLKELKYKYRVQINGDVLSTIK